MVQGHLHLQLQLVHDGRSLHRPRELQVHRLGHEHHGLRRGHPIPGDRRAELLSLRVHDHGHRLGVRSRLHRHHQRWDELRSHHAQQRACVRHHRVRLHLQSRWHQLLRPHEHLLFPQATAGPVGRYRRGPQGQVLPQGGRLQGQGPVRLHGHHVRQLAGRDVGPDRHQPGVHRDALHGELGPVGRLLVRPGMLRRPDGGRRRHRAPHRRRRHELLRRRRGQLDHTLHIEGEGGSGPVRVLHRRQGVLRPDLRLRVQR